MIPQYADRTGPSEPPVIWKCLSCGEELESTRLTSHHAKHEENPVEPKTTSTPIFDGNAAGQPKKWTDVAVIELNGLIRHVQAADAKRAEAERIYKALSTFGVTELPVLPWKAHPSVTCAECGRQFKNVNEYRRLPDGGAVCRRGHLPVQEA
jgi:DNA-directed RNA polymerase subunit RPC12/RpoP